MGELFGSVYCWLEDFFGENLANYLWGEASPLQVGNMYIGIGLWMLGISLAVVLIFYYLINHPRFNNWWSWLIALVVNAALNFLWGWQWVQRDYYAGLMVEEDPTTGKTIALNITERDLFAFGATNMILSVIVFIIFSYMFKWWSSNCSKAPF